ncbi:MAG: hypothetical protein GY795_42370 [Desulfobacterales bacterium]|nr:hypothetical protein [Desulfobacterales bacterium]
MSYNKIQKTNSKCQVNFDLEKIWDNLVNGNYNVVFREGEIEKIREYDFVRFQQAWNIINPDYIIDDSFLLKFTYRLKYFLIWCDIFEKYDIKNNETVLEVGTGSFEIIPKVLNFINKKSIKYISVNTNKKLNEIFINRTRKLSVNIRIIEKNAINLPLGFHKQIQLICMHHAINDIVEEFICEKENIDIANHDWWEIRPMVIKLTKEYYNNENLFDEIKIKFIKLLYELSNALSDNGKIILNHHLFKHELETEYPKFLYINYIDIIRKWIKDEAEIPITEDKSQNLNPKWWLFLRKRIAKYSNSDNIKIW